MLLVKIQQDFTYGKAEIAQINFTVNKEAPKTFQKSLIQTYEIVTDDSKTGNSEQNGSIICDACDRKEHKLRAIKNIKHKYFKDKNLLRNKNALSFTIDTSITEKEILLSLELK